MSSVFLIFPHFFLSGRIFSGNRGKPYTFFVQTVKIRTECLILSKQGAILKHRYIFLYPCPEGVCHVYQSYFSNRRTFISAHRTVSPSHWLRGMWHGCKPIGISGLTKQTRDILFIWNCFFKMPPVRLLPKAFFTNRCRQTAVFQKGQQTNRISNEEIKKVETMKLNGAQIVIETLIEQGTTTVSVIRAVRSSTSTMLCTLQAIAFIILLPHMNKVLPTQQTATPEQPEKLALSSQPLARVQPIWSLVSQQLIWTPFRWLPSPETFRTL